MLNWILKMVPDNYKLSVGLKKVAWTIAKTGVALIAGTKIGSEVSAENWLVVTEVSTALIAGAMKFVHDWARLKWPNHKWI